MSMPTAIAPHPCLPRSGGRLPGSAPGEGTRLAHDPVHLFWIDVKRPDDFVLAEDPLAPDSTGKADAFVVAGLSLRSWRPGDVPGLRAALDDPAVWAHLPEPYPAPLDAAKARALITAANTLPEQTVRAVIRGGVPIGQVRLEGMQGGAGPATREAELSYWLGRDYWGRGLGSTLVAGAVARAFSNLPALARLTAKVRAGNPASARVLRKAGFRECAAPAGTRFSDWHWYALRRQHRGAASPD